MGRSDATRFEEQRAKSELMSEAKSELMSEANRELKKFASLLVGLLKKFALLLVGLLGVSHHFSL